MAEKVEISDRPEDFDAAFETVVLPGRKNGGLEKAKRAN
jgi:hypothetical protein